MSLTCTIIYTINDPFCCDVDPDRAEIYCGGYVTGGWVTILDSSDGSVSGSFEWGGITMKRSIVVDTDANNKIWIGTNTSDLWVLNKLAKTACITYENVGAHTDANIYLCKGTNHVLVIDSDYKTIVAMNRSGPPTISWTVDFGTGGGSPTFRQACADSNNFYLALNSSPFGIVEVQQSDGAILRTISYLAAINSIVYDSLQDKLWCGCFSHVVVFSRSTGNILTTICLDSGIAASGIILAMDAADGTVLAAGYGVGANYGDIYAINTDYTVGTTIAPSANDQYRGICCDPNNSTGVAQGYKNHKINFLEGYDSGC